MSKLNILYLIDKIQYLTKLSRVRFHAIKSLSKIANITYWGNNWDNYDNNLTLDENIKNQLIKYDFIIVYKPEVIKNFSDINIHKCITYNEMWDTKYTLNEINNSKVNLIICHHLNDLIKYKTILFKNIENYVNFEYIGHCAEKTIFYDMKLDKPIDILICGSIGRHYPLRSRYINILKLMPEKYNCIIYKHPGYIHDDAHTDIYLKNFAKTINMSKICLTCTSKHKYRLGKMVEIPLCNSVLACDIPDQDQEIFKDIMIVIDEKMSDNEIKDKLIYYLENNNELEKIRIKGNEWSNKYKQEIYADKLLENLIKYKGRIKKVYVIGDELKNIKTPWICDILKREFIQYSNLEIVMNVQDADIIWLLAPWSHRKIALKYLQEKFVITSIHHIDWEKYDNKYYDFIENITNRYHVICDKTYIELKKITNKKIIIANFWINENNFYNIIDNNLRNKYNLPIDGYIIGSFQKDTEGIDEITPKFSKGPDIFINIVSDLQKKHNNLHILLTGWRRKYIMNELEKLNIKYTYLELVELNELNELYNCLDLYIVSSRVEGGPRSIIECGLIKVPIISTNVGISNLILSENSIYNSDNYITYKEAIPDIEYAYNKSNEYTIKNYMNKFVEKIFYDIIL